MNKQPTEEQEIENTEIPKDMVEFCKSVGVLAKNYHLSRFHLSFNPPIRGDFRNEINADWDSGRHDADVGEITITSKVWLTTKINREVNHA